MRKLVRPVLTISDLNMSREMHILRYVTYSAEFFAGVPDSLLKSFCAHVTDTCGESHVIAANEDVAVGCPA